MELPPEQERRYLFTCLTEVLARLASHRPVLLLLDDVQWEDEPTLAFVEHLAPQLPRMPLLVLLTYREAEVGGPLGRVLSELHRRRFAARIRLEALSETATSDLLEGLAGQSPPPTLAGLVFLGEATKGYRRLGMPRHAALAQDALR